MKEDEENHVDANYAIAPSIRVALEIRWRDVLETTSVCTRLLINDNAASPCFLDGVVCRCRSGLQYSRWNHDGPVVSATDLKTHNTNESTHGTVCFIILLATTHINTTSSLFHTQPSCPSRVKRPRPLARLIYLLGPSELPPRYQMYCFQQLTSFDAGFFFLEPLAFAIAPS